MQRPSALGLFLCDQVIVERQTNRRTLVGLFSVQEGTRFPLTLSSFDVYAALTDGQGRMVLDLLVSNLETEEQLMRASAVISLPDPLAQAHLRFRVQGLTFPTAGEYLFELSVEGEIICHRRLTLNQTEEDP